MKPLALLLALSLPLLTSLAACTRQPASTTTSEPPIKRNQPEQVKPPEPPPACAPSAESERMATLLEQRSYNAAEGLFNKLLQEHPEDARLHVEYVRYLLLSSDLAYSGFVASPIMPDNRFWATDVAREAGQRASQLDAGCKELLADTIHSILVSRIGDSLASGKGIIGEERGFYSPRADANHVQTGFSTSMLNLGWLALEASPGSSAGYLSRYRELMEQAIAKGKLASAAMLGNLLGDLEKGDTTGDLDFTYACDAFVRALENYEPTAESDWIANTIAIFQDIFKEDLANAERASAPESLIRLRKELDSRGYTLIAGGQSPFGLPEGPTGAAPGQP